jgi:hypothetical protein
MNIYTVVKLNLDPHGELMGEGCTYGLFASRKGANAHIKELKECHRYNYRCKDGSLRVRMPEFKVKSVKVQD